MVIGVLKEPSFESRVSLMPEAVATLTKKGITVLVERGAGEKAFSNDDAYTKAGAVVQTLSEIIPSAEIILSIHPPSRDIEIHAGKILIGIFQPLFNKEISDEWARKGITSF